MGQIYIGSFLVDPEADREMPNLTDSEHSELERVLTLMSEGKEYPELVQAKNPLWRMSMAGDVVFVFEALDAANETDGVRRRAPSRRGDERGMNVSEVGAGARR